MRPPVPPSRPDAPSATLTRREALASLARRVAAVAIVGGAPLPSPRAARRAYLHPEPRPGVTSERVLPAERVPARIRDAYAAARAFPATFDGLYCHCDCAERHGELRSLLSCYETDMPLGCGICQGEARLAGKLARKGESLQRIREEVDERYG